MRSRGIESTSKRIDDLPKTIFAIKEVLGSRQGTQRAIEAHQSGDFDYLNGGGCWLHSFLTENIYARKRALDEELTKKGTSLQASWRGLYNKQIAELAKHEDGLIPEGVDPIKHIKSMYSSKIPDEQKRAWKFTERVHASTIRHPEALGILLIQTQYENAVLQKLAPFYSEISPSEIEGNLDYRKEPNSINRAIAEVNEAHLWTQKVLEGFNKSPDERFTICMVEDLPGLMKQDGFFASLIPPGLLLEGKTIQDPLDNQLSDKKDSNPFLAKLTLGNSPKSPEYYMKRVVFEAKLLAALEAQKNGNQPPGQTSLAEVREFAEISSHWTQVTAKTFAAQDTFGWRGGFNHFYRWLNRKESQQYLPEELIEAGRKIWQSWEVLKEDCMRLAIRRTWGVDLGRFDAETVLKELDDLKTHIPTDNVRARGAYLFMADKRSLTHLQKQAEYERKLLGFLVTA